MKRTTLTPPLKSLKIAIASAILGLGAMSGANAQLDSIEKKLQQKFQGLDDNKIAALKKDDTFSILSLMMAANTLTIDEINKDVIKNNNSIQDLDDEMNFLSEDITSLNDDVADIQANIAENNDSIDDLYEANNENVERIVTIDYAVAANRENIQQNNASIDDLYEANAENVERLIQVDDNVFVNRLNIQELKRKQENDIKDVVGMQNAIAEQADKNRNHIKELANAQLESVTFLGEQIQENKDDIANNINNIYELAQQQDQHGSADAKFKGVQTDIANNKITLANHAKKINDNQKAIEAKLGGKVDLQKLAELKTSVDKNQADIADNINNIHELAQQQDQHGSDIRTLAKAGITNKDAIAKNTQSITTLDNKVNTFDGRISALDAKVNGFDGRINALDDKVENSMAAQAALNGLFQPYNVGKVSVSAAVGAYGSKSAIAVGAGYRVNPHLAFKGGAAINTSGSRKGSYNLGINYEF